MSGAPFFVSPMRPIARLTVADFTQKQHPGGACRLAQKLQT
jgi:hypothetical protein